MQLSLNEAMNQPTIAGMVLSILAQEGVINGPDSQYPFRKVGDDKDQMEGRGIWLQGGSTNTLYIQSVGPDPKARGTINLEFSDNKVYYFGSKSVQGMKANLKRFADYGHEFNGLTKTGNPQSDETRFGYKVDGTMTAFQKAQRLAVAAEHLITLRNAIFA